MKRNISTISCLQKNLFKLLFLLQPVLSIDIFPGHFISGGDVSTLYFIATTSLSGTSAHSISYRLLPYRGRQYTLYRDYFLIGEFNRKLEEKEIFNRNVKRNISTISCLQKNLFKILFLLQPVLSIDIFPSHFISGGDVSTLYFIETTSLSGKLVHSI